MDKDNFEIKNSKCIVIYLPKFVNFETFSKYLIDAFTLSEKLNRMPIILNFDNIFINIKISDIVILFNNNKIFNTSQAKLTELALIYNGKNHNEIIDMIEMSLKNIGFIKVKKFKTLDEALNWISEN